MTDYLCKIRITPRGAKISAIKMVRDIFGGSLTGSKNFVEEFDGKVIHTTLTSEELAAFYCASVNECDGEHRGAEFHHTCYKPLFEILECNVSQSVQVNLREIVK